jgi:3',5'-cyclic AMP phosphodiesterase CpdA
VCSDVHLEDGPPGLGFDDVVEPSAPYLVLAGDIGDPFSDAYREFLHRASGAFRRVFVVAGNHEFFGPGLAGGPGPVHARIAAVCEAAPAGNVTFLERSSFELEEHGGVTIVGLTLWSHIPREHWDAACRDMADFKYVRGLTPASYGRAHREHAAWLQGQLHAAVAAGRRLVVVTHHAPSMVGTSLARYTHDPLRFCYKNQMDHLVSMPCNLAWVCGHTHFSFSIKKGKCTLASNQFRSKLYRKDFVLTVGA